MGLDAIPEPPPMFEPELVSAAVPTVEAAPRQSKPNIKASRPPADELAHKATLPDLWRIQGRTSRLFNDMQLVERREHRMQHY